eukprot:jgi/Undpi1/7307/HiC_scaffold_22.g09780.m1
MSCVDGGSIVCTDSLSNIGTSSVSCPSLCHPFLKTKFQIGSVKGPKNFCSTQTVFHRDDVPAQRRERKKDVKDWKERRILAVGQPPPWSSSVTLDPSRLKYARTKSNSDLDPGKPYRYNYRAEALPSKSPHPVPRPHRFKVSCVTEAEAEKRRAERAGYPNNAVNHPKRLAEMPVNRRLDDMEAWNHSTQLGPPERRRTLEDYEAACKLATTRRARHLRAYTAPEQRGKEQRQRIRQLKSEGRLWTLREPEPIPLGPTHNRLARDPIRRVRQFRHSGKWEFRESEGCHMWSDTACFERNSPGDVVRVHNPTGFNFSSPCLTRVVARELS